MRLLFPHAYERSFRYTRFMADYARKQAKIKVLFVAANPTRPHLWLDEEIRAISQKIRAAEHRDMLDISQIWATRPDDLLQSLNIHKPHIVHFSAHGSSTGQIILSDHNRQAKPISPEALRALFAALKDNVRVVLLNACYSLSQAQAITSVIDCAIGMNNAIGDDAAITFAAAFYQALAFGRSIQEAFEQSKAALQLEGIPEHTTPELLCKAGVRPSHIHIVTSAEQTSASINKNRLRLVQDALLQSDYNSAYRCIDSLLKTSRDELAAWDMAKLKYLEALVHLQGKRPCVQSPSIMQSVEGLMRAAGQLHRCYAYAGILAVFKYDFARAGLRRRELEAEASRLIKSAQRYTLKAEDRENITLLAKVQPRLYQDYRNHLYV